MDHEQRNRRLGDTVNELRAMKYNNEPVSGLSDSDVLGNRNFNLTANHRARKLSGYNNEHTLSLEISGSC